MPARALLGKKIGMTQMFSPDGRVTPVTAIEAGPCAIIQHRTTASDGYVAVQIGFDPKRRKAIKKPEKGHCEKAGVEPRRFVREIRLASDGELESFPLGDDLRADVFEVGEYVDVIGTSKGHGFTGVMKRHNFGGAHSMTHGTHEKFRHGGAIGAGATPGRVFAGTKMAGQHGNARRTVRNLEVMRVDVARNLIYVKGAVPGAPNGYLYIRPAKKKRAPVAD